MCDLRPLDSAKFVLEKSTHVKLSNSELESFANKVLKKFFINR